MSEGEGFLFMIGLAVSAATAFTYSASRLHPLYTRGNAGIGLHRVVVLASVAFAAYVIRFHGDPSIQGIYVVFYLVLAYAAVKLFGQGIGPAILGLSVRRDAFVGRSWPVALFTGAFALTTGVLYGASLWGEADPLSEDEGGWWIPIGFFLLGWTILVTATALYVWRAERFQDQLRRELDSREARTAAVFVLSSGALIFQGVAGDFWGWMEGVLSLSAIALMLIGHDLLVARLGKPEDPFGKGSEVSLRELLQHALFLGLALLAWWLNDWIAARFTVPIPGS